MQGRVHLLTVVFMFGNISCITYTVNGDFWWGMYRKNLYCSLFPYSIPRVFKLVRWEKKKHGKKGTEKKKKQHSFLPCSIINGSFLSGSEYLIFLLHGLNTPLIY